MKRFSTLLTAAAVLFTVQVHAQYSSNFDDYNSLNGNCWAWNNVLYTTIPGEVINGTASIYSNPPTNSTQTRDIGTPYLDVTGTTISVSYWYKTSEDIKGQTVRTVETVLRDKNGVTTTLDLLVLKNNSGVTTTKLQRTINATNITPGTYQLFLRLGGDQGGGTVRLIIDDLYTSASPHYGTGTCNTAPVAVPDAYESALPVAFSGNVITNPEGTDYDNNAGESITASLVSQPDPLQGSVVMNADGSFTFTPAATFTGGLITFTYRLVDNGFTPFQSNTATVSIEYPAKIISPLPVKLMSFSGSTSNNKANLRWSVADNETGDRFYVLRSADGKNFTEVGIVFINPKVGAESYTFVDPRDLDAVTYYKLKIINKDGPVNYSNIITLKSTTDKSSTGITILKNPVESTLTFTYTASTANQGQVSIYNAVGVKVYSSRINSQKGTNAVSMNLDSHLASGTYILEVVNGSERAVTRMIKK